MYKYSFKGHCPENREKAFCEVEEIIRSYGLIVAFTRSSDVSMNVMVEVPEKKAERLIFYLERYMSLSELKQDDNIKAKQDCKILINLEFQN